MKDIDRKIATSIGYFFLNDKGGNYDSTYEIIDRLKIKSIEYDESTKLVHITLGRPGIFIGPKGKTIEALKEWITKDLEMEIDFYIVEDKLDNFLYPIHPTSIAEIEGW